MLTCHSHSGPSVGEFNEAVYELYSSLCGMLPDRHTGVRQSLPLMHRILNLTLLWQKVSQPRNPTIDGIYVRFSITMFLLSPDVSEFIFPVTFLE